MSSIEKSHFACDNDSEVRALILAYRNDDELAFDKLAELYKPLTEAMVSGGFERLSDVYEREDINQYVLIAFSKAVLTYNLEQNKISFGLYAKVCIGNSIASRIRAANRSNVQLLPFEELCGLADSTDVSHDVIDMERVGELRRLMKNNLSKLENEVFLLYASGCSATEIGIRLGKNEKSVANAIFRARLKMKAVLSGASK